MKHISK
jgi:chromosome segregation ATPase